MADPVVISVRSATESDAVEWRRLRHLLWPVTTETDHAADWREYAGAPASHVILVAPRPHGGLAGFAEVRLRSHADECASSPVAFLEGWFVDEDMRGRGVGRALIRAAEDWARDCGCTEFASDTEAENGGSIAAHRALGFIACEPTVNFRKVL